MSGIYIHIPFCKQACSYCDFHFSTSLKYKDELIEAIKTELKHKSLWFNKEISTIYFGGGTPSIVPIQDIKNILETIFKSFSVKKDIEITLEANPDDINPKVVLEWTNVGINRLSMGIQSFHDNELQFMKRAHSSKEAKQAISDSIDNGIKNISIDLIYGVPGSTTDSWKQNLEIATSFKVTHISSYCLTVEEKTLLNHWVNKDQVKLVDDELSLQQFEMLIKHLNEQNFEHYEISNFSLDGFRSKHNTSYWEGKEYIGIGPSAHSFYRKEDEQYRAWNISNNAKYIKDPIHSFEEEKLTPKDIFNEYILTRLRTIEGISKSEFDQIIPKEHRNEFDHQIMNLIQSGHLLETEDTVKLSSSGKFIADKIIGDLFYI